MTREYLVGYEISGHLLIEAQNPQAAAATAIGIVRSAASNLEEHGENEYRCPSGGMVDLTPVQKTQTTRTDGGE